MGNVLGANDASRLWQLAVGQVLEHGHKVQPVASPTSPSAGKATREVRGSTLTLRKPAARYIKSQVRPLNTAFCLGNFLYFLSESSTVDGIAYYNPLAEKFSDNGYTLHGAYAPRIMRQVLKCLALLKEDPYTRRAFTTVLGPEDYVASRDIPCPIAFQFMVRDEELHMFVMLRSQNIAMVFPYDIFLFTMIHEWMAGELGVKLGLYEQYCTSLHFYEDELDLARQIVSDTQRCIEMAPMTPLRERKTYLLQAEHEFRMIGLGAPSDGRKPNKLQDDPYWGQILNMLEHISQVKRRGSQVVRDDNLLSSLEPRE